MSSLQQKTERAMFHALRSRLVDVDSTDTSSLGSGGHYVTTATGVAITLTTGTTLDVQFHVGESEMVLTPPLVLIVAETATKDQDSPWWFVPVRVEVRINADSDTITPDVIATLETMSESIANAIWEPGFEDILSVQQDRFTCLGFTDEANRERSVDGRTRIHTYTRTLFCAEADIN